MCALVVGSEKQKDLPILCFHCTCKSGEFGLLFPHFWLKSVNLLGFAVRLLSG